MRLQRTTDGRGGAPTFGEMRSNDGAFGCVTLERSADGDHPRIPAGIYDVHRTVHHPETPHAYECWELDTSHLDPVRTYIHIHIANRAEQLRGCIATGERVDGAAIDASEAAFDRLMEYTAGLTTWKLEIIDPPTGECGAAALAA